jgi:HSP20 family protein
MPIIKWEPFGEIERFFEEIPSIFPEKITGFTPAMDVYETKDKVVVETPLAGVDPEDVDITIKDDVLTVKGKTEKKEEVEEKDYYRKEIRYGSFYRSVSLPTHVLGDKATATSTNGLLKIEIPKAPEVKAKTVKVKIAAPKKAAKVKVKKKK